MLRVRSCRRRPSPPARSKAMRFDRTSKPNIIPPLMPFAWESRLTPELRFSHQSVDLCFGKQPVFQFAARGKMALLCTIICRRANQPMPLFAGYHRQRPDRVSRTRCLFAAPRSRRPVTAGRNSFSDSHNNLLFKSLSARHAIFAGQSGWQQVTGFRPVNRRCDQMERVPDINDTLNSI